MDYCVRYRKRAYADQNGNFPVDKPPCQSKYCVNKSNTKLKIS